MNYDVRSQRKGKKYVSYINDEYRWLFHGLTLLYFNSTYFCFSLYCETEEQSASENSSLWNQQEVPDLPKFETCEPHGHLREVAPGKFPNSNPDMYFAYSTLYFPSSPGPTLRWNPEMTTQLIKVRGDMDEEFTKAKYKFRLWEQLAIKLNKILDNVKVTAKDCDDKWRNIVATYRKNIDKMKCCGDNPIRWEYFNAMDNILKGTKELLTNEHPSHDFVSDETMTNLLCSLDPIKVDVIGQPVDLISVRYDE